MTPLSGFVRRLLGGDAQSASQSTSTSNRSQSSRRRSDQQGDGSSDPDGQRRRRRGRRGGRGRNLSDQNSAPQNDSAQNKERGGRSATAEPRQNDDRDRSGGPSRRDGRGRGGNNEVREGEREGNRSGGARNDGRGNRGGNGGNREGGNRTGGGSARGGSSSGEDSGTRKGSYGWGGVARDGNQRDALAERRQRAQQRRRDGGGFRPRRGSLEAPLPEDVAFRPVDAGGAGDILPNRRRRPKTFRSTERVIVGGARSLTGIPRTIGGARPPLDMSEHREDEVLLEEDLVEEIDDLDDEAILNDDDEDFDDLVDEEDLDGDDLDDDEQPVAALDPDQDADDGEVLIEADDDDEDRARRRRRRGGRRQRDRREAALARGEAEEDDDVPVDQDHAIAAVVELPRVVQRARAQRDEPLQVPPAFTALGLNGESLAWISRLGFTEPTPIQTQSIPALLDGHDVVGVAQTGSGKTLAFGLPMIERIDPDEHEVQTIVLVPTRELAQQVLDVLSDIGRSRGLRTAGLLGGHALKRDFAALREQPHVVVGTPGRIIDHLRRETLSLRRVRYAVLDEADQMLDIGFLPDIRRILGRTPRARQTALFSATMPTSIRRLIWQFMEDPVTVTVDSELSTVDTVEQIYFEVAQRDKTAGLRELVERELKGRTLVFCNMRRGVDRLAHDLEGRGVRVGALHGDMDQRRRDKVVEQFRRGELDILIATNVAARGLDIPEITHVVNFDAPQNAEEYVHRIGRTGRAGRHGKAITFVGEWDYDNFKRVTDEFGDEMTKERLDLYTTNG